MPCRARSIPAASRPLDWPALDDPDQQQDDGDDQQDVEKATQRVGGDHSEQPQHDENHDQRHQWTVPRFQWLRLCNIGARNNERRLNIGLPAPSGNAPSLVVLSHLDPSLLRAPTQLSTGTRRARRQRSDVLENLLRRLGRAPDPERPLRDELLSIERLEERAKSLAARFTIAPPSGRVKRLFPRLSDNARVLSSAYAALADDVHRGQVIAPPAEWLLDHFHLVTAEIRAVRQDLPHVYYRQLPRLPQRQWAGHTRVYAMALELIRHSDSRLDRSQLIRFMNSYQSVAPLTIGELWAWPSILKLALIENLRRLAEEILVARASRMAADATVAGCETGLPPASLPPSAARRASAIECDQASGVCSHGMLPV